MLKISKIFFYSKYYLFFVAFFLTQFFRFYKKHLFGNGFRVNVRQDDWGASKFVSIGKTVNVPMNQIAFIDENPYQKITTEAYSQGKIFFALHLLKIRQVFFLSEEQVKFLKDKMNRLFSSDPQDFIVSVTIDKNGKLVLFSGYHRFFVAKQKGLDSINVNFFGGFIKPRFSYKLKNKTYKETKRLLEPFSLIK